MPHLLDLNAISGVALVIGGVLAFAVVWELIERGLKALGVTLPKPTAEDERITEELGHW